MQHFQPRNTQSDRYKLFLNIQYPSTVLLVHTVHFQPVRIISNTYVSFPTRTGHFQCIRVISNAYGSFSIHTYHFQHTQIFSNPSEYTQSIANTSNHFRFQKLPYAFYLSPFHFIYHVQSTFSVIYISRAIYVPILSNLALTLTLTINRNPNNETRISGIVCMCNFPSGSIWTSLNLIILGHINVNCFSSFKNLPQSY